MAAISKNQFIAILNDVIAANEMAEKIDRIFCEYKCQDFRSGYAYYDCTMINHIVTILDLLTNDNQWVEYWVNELECGRKWNADMVEDPLGNSIDLTTPEKLYDFLFGPNVF